MNQEDTSTRLINLLNKPILKIEDDLVRIDSDIQMYDKNINYMREGINCLKGNLEKWKEKTERLSSIREQRINVLDNKKKIFSEMEIEMGLLLKQYLSHSVKKDMLKYDLDIEKICNLNWNNISKMKHTF